MGLVMIRIVIDISGEVDDTQGVKEKLAMDMEKYGDVRVISVEHVGEDQLRLEG